MLDPGSKTYNVQYVYTKAPRSSCHRRHSASGPFPSFAVRTTAHASENGQGERTDDRHTAWPQCGPWQLPDAGRRSLARGDEKGPPKKPGPCAFAASVLVAFLFSLHGEALASSITYQDQPPSCATITLWCCSDVNVMTGLDLRCTKTVLQSRFASFRWLLCHNAYAVV